MNQDANLCFPAHCTGLPNKACPRLRDLATAPARGITQPRTNLIWEPCISIRHLGCMKDALLLRLRHASSPCPSERIMQQRAPHLTPFILCIQHFSPFSRILYRHSLVPRMQRQIHFMQQIVRGICLTISGQYLA